MKKIVYVLCLLFVSSAYSNIYPSAADFYNLNNGACWLEGSQYNFKVA